MFGVDPVSPISLLNYIQTGGVIAILLVVLYGGKQGWWVFGWYAKELRDRLSRKDEEMQTWKDLALRSTNLAESLDEVARSKIHP